MAFAYPESIKVTKQCEYIFLFIPLFLYNEFLGGDYYNITNVMYGKSR
jgi:hypothetical protein